MKCVTWLDNLPGTGFDEKLPFVQMGQDKLEPTEGFCKREGMLHKEIISLSLELWVLLLLNDEHDITSDCIRLFSNQHRKSAENNVIIRSKEKVSNH